MEAFKTRHVAPSPNHHVAVVIPCFRVGEIVLDVLSKIPRSVERIYCIDDACPDKSGELIKARNTDPRVAVIVRAQNGGVGRATCTGFEHALRDGAEIIVKIDGDGQMDPSLIPVFVDQIARGNADYAKGNRFFQIEDVTQMPLARLIGNAGLSFLTKLSSGYWRVFDPTNGYFAIHAKVLSMLPLHKISGRYFFESDMLFRLGTIRAVVVDVPHRALYGDEQSNLSVLKAIPTFAFNHAVRFLKRVYYTYFLRDFHVASLEWLLGPALLVGGSIFAINAWISAIAAQVPATAGTVGLIVLSIVLGMQMLLSALSFDIGNQPSVPLHRTIAEGVTDLVSRSNSLASAQKHTNHDTEDTQDVGSGAITGATAKNSRQLAE